MKKLTSLVLVIIVLCSIGVGAFANDLPDNPIGDAIDVGSGDNLTNNNGTVTTNNGIVTNNNNGGTVYTNEGTVKINNGTVETNYCIVGAAKSSDYTVLKKYETENAFINEFGTTYIYDSDSCLYLRVNNQNETIPADNALIIYETDFNQNSFENRTIFKDNDSFLINSNGEYVNNKGERTGNNGQVITNNGTVAVNSQNGTVSTNDTGGTVTSNNGIVTTNNGIVTKNDGTITTNGTGGVVIGNKGTVTSNSGIVETNNGTVKTNNGAVENNTADGTVENNNGIIGATRTSDYILLTKQDIYNYRDNKGMLYSYDSINQEYVCIDYARDGSRIEKHIAAVFVLVKDGIEEDTYNNAQIKVDEEGYLIDNNGKYVNNKGETLSNSGTVENNNGTVENNNGTVTTNTITGTVYNKNNGEVKENYGMVIESDGTTKVGVVVNDTDGEGGSELKQFIKNVVNVLTDLFKRDGYELKGYIDGNSADVVESAEYTAAAPGSISLVWEEIQPDILPKPPIIPADVCYFAPAKPYSIGSASGNTIKMKYNSASTVLFGEQDIMKTTISVDGQNLGSDAFIISFDSSTKDFEIIFSQEFLSTLSAGTHTVKLTVLGYEYNVSVTV